MQITLVRAQTEEMTSTSNFIAIMTNGYHHNHMGHPFNPNQISPLPEIEKVYLTFKLHQSILADEQKCPNSLKYLTKNWLQRKHQPAMCSNPVSSTQQICLPASCWQQLNVHISHHPSAQYQFLSLYDINTNDHISQSISHFITNASFSVYVAVDRHLKPHAFFKNGCIAVQCRAYNTNI